MFYIGCHLSASDGFLAMGRTALSIGANTFQFFTRNPRGSKAKAIDPADAVFARDDERLRVSRPRKKAFLAALADYMGGGR